MFVDAIQRVGGFTRAIHSIAKKPLSNQIEKGAATLFFVNNQGWALTCKHVSQWISQADQINRKYESFRSELKHGKVAEQDLMDKYSLSTNQAVEMRITFVDCVDRIEKIHFFNHPVYDLALLKFEGFEKIQCSNFPVFAETDQTIQPGQMLCRLGFPFPEFSNFKWDASLQQLLWTKEGQARSPRFPIEGMVTRFLGDKAGKVYGIEMSTPGLRGQSGGPLFDGEGRIAGMQSRTKHLHLGFDIEEKEIVAHGTPKKVNDYAFIHLGECIHVSVIKAFLDSHQVSYQIG